MRTVLLLCVWLFSIATHAGEISSINIKHDDDHYTVDMDVVIHAPLTNVRQVMTDYDNMVKVNPAILESERLYNIDEHTYRVRIVTEGCVLFFCVTMLRTQDIEERPDGDIIGTMIPGQSDFRFGRSRWHLEAQGPYTRVTYHSELVPDFWVPPLIGPWILKNKLEEETVRTINGIEQRARTLFDDARYERYNLLTE